MPDARRDDADCCPVVELRQYTLHPGARDALIRLFDEHFVESQEACGMRVIGQFRDLGDPDRFVWLRGFSDMNSRTRALECFYSGPIWKTYRDAANATMIDSDNVLLLRRAGEGAGFPPTSEPRAGINGPEPPAGIIAATIYYFDRPAEPSFLSWFETEATPVLAQAGTSVVARFVTEHSRNTFRLPVREGENVFVWFAAYSDRPAHEAAVRTVEELASWKTRMAPRLSAATIREPERLVLAPTARSRLR